METTRTKTLPWDAAEHLETEEDMALYLEAALEEGDASLVAAALGDIARAKGMTETARQAGVGRKSLYKALSPEGSPELVDDPSSRGMVPCLPCVSRAEWIEHGNSCHSLTFRPSVVSSVRESL